MRARQGQAPAWLTDIPGLLRLQRSFLERWAGYSRTVGDLAGSGTIDPGDWIEGYMKFWSDTIADVGEWMRESQGERRPPDEPLRVYRAQVQPRQRTTSFDIDVPNAAFGTPGDRRTKITLVTDGLLRKGGGRMLDPHKNVTFHPSVVSVSDPRSSLKLFDLLNVVRAGDVYRGVIWTAEKTVPVAAVEVDVV